LTDVQARLAVTEVPHGTRIGETCTIVYTVGVIHNCEVRSSHGDADTNSHLLGHNSVLHDKFTDVPVDLEVWTIWSMKTEAVSFSETSAAIHDDKALHHIRHKSVSIVYIMHC